MNTSLSYAQQQVIWGIASAVRHMTPVNPEERKRYLDFKQYFVESAGTEEDPFGPEDGISDNPNDRLTIVSVIGDAAGKNINYRSDLNAWVRAIEHTLYNDPEYRCELIINVPRDVMVDGVVRAYLHALEGPSI